MTSLMVAASLLAIAAEAPVESASKKPRREVVVKDGVTVEGDSKRAVQIVIPRNRSVSKDIESTSDHLLESTQRR